MMMKFLAVACFVAAAQGAKIRNEGRVVRSHLYIASWYDSSVDQSLAVRHKQTH